MFIGKISVSQLFGVGVVTILLVGAATPANAKLKDSPPRNVFIDGSWQIDIDSSDDAAEVIDNANESLNEGVQSRSGGMRGGGMHGGHRGHNRQDTSASSGNPSEDSAGNGNRRAIGQKLLSELQQNPTTLVVLSKQHALRISTDQNSSECEAAEKVAVSDSNGNSERQCGWDGRAWVIETVYAHSFTRTDRYELSRDGKQLTYITKVSGGRTPAIKLKRVYRR